MIQHTYIVMNNGKIEHMSVLASSALEAYRKIKAQYPDARIFKPISH